ncbi:hypothetical protein LVJ82_01205 [Vitreoscilla massiliensis]|uniref:Uncharacterized protein n=1 Tax=Vitreoscilla massiliensis TaxID=1689272 RepID=A0ABY4E1G2_9NEIS|nr:hypothetical protein [Vitreoscilla massiliensis]UOO89633.1 hypothetical protein LVJ82_01205 [Vitreoscilla massiliensis]
MALMDSAEALYLAATFLGSSNVGETTPNKIKSLFDTAEMIQQEYERRFIHEAKYRRTDFYG